MLARLLRRLYFFQLLIGGLLGAVTAIYLKQRGAGDVALLLMPLGALLLPLWLQLLVITSSMLLSRTPDAGRLWWQTYQAEFLAALRIYWLQLPWASGSGRWRLPAQGEPAQPRPPVLLVHGFICNYRIWDKLAQALQRAGYPVLAVNLEPLFTSIEDYVRPIETGVQALQQQTGARQVVLLGHSMGGLAIRAWMRARGSTAVARVITLGTPHQGTAIANWATAPNALQMRWRSPWLQALQTSEGPEVRRLMQLALSPHDNIVYPQRAQVLDGASVTEFEGVGHLEMCLNDAVIAWVLQQLATVEPLTER